MICFARAIQFIGGAAAQSVPPSNTVAPSITGTAQVGQALNASTGTWAGDAPITYAFRWQFSADGATGWTDIADATASTFTPQVAQQGLYLRALVRGTNAAGPSGWVPSNVVGPVAAALAAPARVSAPGIAGTLEVGQIPVVSPLAVYSGSPEPTVSYRWQMRPNGGGTITQLGTGPSLALTEAQLGMQIRVQDMASNSQGSTSWATNGWQGPVAAAPVVYPRTATPSTATLLFAGHSFVQTAYGRPTGEDTTFGGVLQADWPGTALSDFAPYASMATIRALDGHLLNDSYDAAIISEFTNPAGPGFPNFDTDQGRETLQNAYWDAMDAQRAGGELIVQDIWPPLGRTDLYANATGFSQGVREWLEMHTGRPVWIIPAFPFVEAMRAAYGDAIYSDGLHLARGDSPYPRGMSYLVYSFLTQQRCPFVRAGDEAIDQMAWDTLLAYECAGMGGTIRYTSTLPATDPLSDPAPLPGETGPTLKPGTLSNPPFAMTPGWPAPWAANHCPFTNWLKVARQYQTFGSVYMEWGDLLANGHIDRNGVIQSIPAGADNITMFTLENLPFETGASGRFRLFFEGSGVVSVGGAAENVDDSVPGQIDFDYDANGQSLVPIAVISVDTPIRLLGLVHHADLADYANPDLKGFRPAWLNIVRNARVLRFKEWMAVDSQWGTSQWANRYLPSRVTYQGEEGMPFEVMCDLCNVVGADPWFMLKSPTDDAYSASAAALVRSALDPTRHAYVEWSDKWWDGNNQGTFFWIQNLADQWFGDTSLESMSQAYAGRASEVFAIWRDEWTGADASRLHTVLQSWTGGAYFNQRLFEAPDYITMRGAGTPTPYSLTTHFVLDSKIDGGLSFPESDQLATIEGWIDTLTVEQVWDNMASACQAPFQGLEGYTLAGNSAFWEDHKTSLAANYPNVTVICGEGGWHLSVPYAHQDDPEWVSIYTGFVRSPQGAAIFSGTMERWYMSFTDPANMFNRYSDVSRPDANQSQGIQRFVGDDGSDNLQWAAWLTQQAARQGATGRGATDFTGPYDLAAGG